MANGNITYLGIDLMGARKPFSYVALDSACRAIALGEGKLNDVLSYAAGLGEAWVAINGPARPNAGLMAREEVRGSLFPTLAPGQWSDLRQAEYELVQRGIEAEHTPARAEDCPPWMRRGFILHGQLAQCGYRPYPEQDAHVVLDLQSSAAFWSLIGKQPYERTTLEGRLQRQLVLYQEDLPVPDPIAFFEEITPHRLLQGLLPLERIYNPYELNAWMAAYTAWLARNHPERIVCLGAEEEGQLVIPLPESKNQNR